MSTQEALVVADGRALTAPEIRAQVNLIQQVMEAVMQKDVHYGTVPGTQKPSLYKAGAEKLGMTFGITIDSTVEADLSNDDVVRYRVRSVASTRAGVFLGAALGECSSNEEKYRWRKAVCRQEFDEEYDDQRRRKWKQDGSFVEQVRTEPADIANTVLKMAAKRADIAVILKVTAASDIFTQDVEDMAPEVRDEVGDKAGRSETKSTASETKGPSGETISEPQRKRAFAIASGKGWTLEQYRACIQSFGFKRDNDITKGAMYEQIVARLEQGPNPAEAKESPDVERGNVPDGWDKN